MQSTCPSPRPSERQRGQEVLSSLPIPNGSVRKKNKKTNKNEKNEKTKERNVQRRAPSRNPHTSSEGLGRDTYPLAAFRATRTKVNSSSHGSRSRTPVSTQATATRSYTRRTRYPSRRSGFNPYIPRLRARTWYASSRRWASDPAHHLFRPTKSQGRPVTHAIFVRKHTSCGGFRYDQHLLEKQALRLYEPPARSRSFPAGRSRRSLRVSLKPREDCVPRVTRAFGPQGIASFRPVRDGGMRPRRREEEGRVCKKGGLHSRRLVQASAPHATPRRRQRRPGPRRPTPSASSILSQQRVIV